MGELPRHEYSNKRVLIVDDQHEIHEDFREIIGPSHGKLATDKIAKAFQSASPVEIFPAFELLHAMSGEEACDTIKTANESGERIALAYVDIRMPPGIDGIQAIREIRSFDRDIETVVMTAYTDMPLSRILLDMDLLHKLLYVRKPFSREVIQQLTLSLVAKWNVEQELAAQQRELVESHQRLEAVLDATGDAMAMYDSDSRLLFSNKRYENLLGASPEEIRAIAPENAANRFKRYDHMLPAEYASLAVVRDDRGEIVKPATPNSDDKEIYYRSVRSVQDNAGEVMGNLISYRDLSNDIEIERMKVEVMRLRTELEKTYSFEGLIGESATMKRVFSLIEQGASTDLPVLITGESGTGKELVARSLHNTGVRKDGPFVAINCASLPEGLIESELFGHEKGAFTGASQLHVGVFERVDGGTLFLDEITEMGSTLQAKLLRALEEREIQRLGAKDVRSIDVRVIAATNRDAAAAFNEGSFRDDLYYRLAAFPIEMPALREHPEDIPLLAKRFLDESAEHASKSVDGFSDSAMQVLIQYEWPGNVRELRNVIARAVVLETSHKIQVGNLPTELTSKVSDNANAFSDRSLGGVATLAEVERLTIERALTLSGGNIASAASRLGINRTTLYRKLKKLNSSSAK